MRGNPKLQNPMFFVANTEERLPKDHPLRAIQRRADEVLKQMARAFDAAYSETGRPGIPPEALLKALLLQALYSIPSERRLVDAINWNLLDRWFCDLDQAVRQYLAWKSIVDEAITLNLDPFQSSQARTKYEQASETVAQRIPETYVWLFVPGQGKRDPNAPIDWQEIRLQGQDALAVRASKRLKNEELLNH